MFYKHIIRGLIEGSLREVIGNLLILNSLLPPYSYTYIIFDETNVKHFQSTIKFGYGFLAMFQSFFSDL